MASTIIIMHYQNRVENDQNIIVKDVQKTLKHVQFPSAVNSQQLLLVP